MDNANDDLITLSVGAANTIGAENTEFELKQTAFSDLPEIAKTYNYSHIQFKDGIRKKENFVRAEILIADIDHGLTIDNAHARLIEKRINHVIVTTKSHTKEAHRFRIFLQIDRPILISEEYESVAHKVHDKLLPEWDVATLDAARFFFYSPKDAETRIYQGGTPIQIDDTTVIVGLNMLEYAITKAGSWSNDLEVITGDGVKVKAGSIKEKTIIFCPFHIEEHPSAFIDFSAKSQNFYIHCSACSKTWWKTVSQDEVMLKFERYWSIGNSLFEVLMINGQLSVSEITWEKIFIQLGISKKNSENDIKKIIVKEKHLPKIDQIVKIGDVNADAPFFEVDRENCRITVHVPAVKAIAKDNEFIEKYLERLFGDLTVTIKQFLAVYCFTNHRRLPVLVLTGPRGCGKNTFAELVVSIFESLSQMWQGQLGNFTPELELKLLVADETITRDHEQYNYLKQISGSNFHVINKKFREPYTTINNLNVIILSNSKLPIYVNPNERPVDEFNNQFLVVALKPLEGAIDQMMVEKLKDRLGYYVQTELKRVFENLFLNNCRYSIRVPITKEEAELFDIGGSDIDFEIDLFIKKEISDAIISPGCVYDGPTPFLEIGLIPTDFLRLYVTSRNLKLSAFVRRLAERDYIISTKMTLERKDSNPSQRTQRGGNRKRCYRMTDKAIEETGLKEYITNLRDDACHVMSV